MLNILPKPMLAKLTGGLLAVAIGVTAMAGHAGRANADTPSCFPPACQIGDLRADLTIKDLAVSKGANGKMVVKFKFANQGAFTANHAKYVILVDGQVASQLTYGSLAGGQAISETINLPLPANGKAVVQVTADPGDTVNESNENNNTAVVGAIL